MINSLVGFVTQKSLDGIYLQSGSIEWFLLMSQNAQSSLEVNQEYRILTYLHHKEDIMQLFGFKETSERTLFFELIKVDGIGPKAALKILSHFTVATFQEALQAPDTKILAKAPGLGLKTAQKVMLALKGKLILEDAMHKDAPASKELYNDELIAPLVAMGFDKKEVSAKLKSIRLELGSNASESEILRLVISSLS